MHWYDVVGVLTGAWLLFVGYRDLNLWNTREGIAASGFMAAGGVTLVLVCVLRLVEAVLTGVLQ